MRQENYERLQERSRRELGDRRDFHGESNLGEFNRPQNLRSARSDYNDDTRGGEDRGWFEKASDEVSSWFGGDDRDNRNHSRNARDRNVNEYDGNSYHSNPAGYTPKEANPYYPTTNRIYERDERNSERDDFSNRNFQSNQNHNSNQPRGFVSIGNQNNRQQGQNRWRDWHDTRAGDLMTRNVATVQPNETVQRAARLMRDEDCGALPVIDRQGRMIGMITDRDIAVRIVADGADPRYAQVQDCMSDEVFACHADDPIEGCIRAMKQHQVRRIAIVNDRNQLLGIISQGDLARHADMNKQQGERHAITNMIAGVSEPSNGAYR